ncbi:MAG: hypothetical protein GTO55_10960, partial [Armatimonadetes bacterium]|nr:hypothetical protein [Armatimonadota bacterium]NIM24751.1 hypothetical protein [Armatimonadota bacterium]NIM68630.1 hypothetical protein [Armatimonadota bacterium]NIM76946.1 hypothetical protein [Armatimonadota bacterium]NIN06832.1 hypothetical protein [Armatimonadota bacterium]
MPLRFLLICPTHSDASRLERNLDCFGGDVKRIAPEHLVEQAGELPSVGCIILDVSGRCGDLGDLCEMVKRVRAWAEKPLLAAIAERDLAAFRWPPEIDDLIVLPCRQAELEARLKRALLFPEEPCSANLLTAGDLTLNPDSYEVRVKGARVDLTLKEYELLKHLMARPERVFTREQLLNSIWDYEYFGGTRTVDVHIRRLRFKLGEAGERYI